MSKVLSYVELGFDSSIWNSTTCLEAEKHDDNRNTGGPRYSRSFYPRFRLHKLYIGLFICGFVIRGSIFEERIYRE
jgi:hypothetical protein